jgi:hypothetical protein
MAWAVPEGHDPSSLDAARSLVQGTGVPLGLIYKDTSREPFESRIDEVAARTKAKTTRELVDALSI